jgi:hypothetical protein
VSVTEKPSNLDQARALYELMLATDWRKVLRENSYQPHRCNLYCRGIACIQPMVLGQINRPSFTGDDALWGPEAAGNLFANYDYRTDRVVRIAASMAGGRLGLTPRYARSTLVRVNGARRKKPIGIRWTEPELTLISEAALLSEPPMLPTAFIRAATLAEARRVRIRAMEKA